jgi:hypothetical protein
MKLLVLIQDTFHPEYSLVSYASRSTYQLYEDDDVMFLPYFGCKDDNGNLLDIFNYIESPKDKEIIYNSKFNYLIYGGVDYCPRYKEYKCNYGFSTQTFYPDNDPRNERFINVLDYCIKNYDFDFIYRTTCAYYIDIKQLKENIENYFVNKTKVYTGSIFHHLNFVAGSNVLMSRDTSQILVEHKDKYLEFSINNPEDVATGRVLVDHLNYIDITTQQIDPIQILYQENIQNIDEFYVNSNYVCYKIYNSSNVLDIKRFFKIHKLIEQKNI